MKTTILALLCVFVRLEAEEQLNQAEIVELMLTKAAYRIGNQLDSDSYTLTDKAFYEQLQQTTDKKLQRAWVRRQIILQMKWDTGALSALKAGKEYFPYSSDSIPDIEENLDKMEKYHKIMFAPDEER
jgi:hypothetical protein